MNDTNNPTKCLQEFIGNKIDISLISNFATILNNHKPTPSADKVRWQDPVIVEEVANNSSVLDLGCGGGELLKKLTVDKNVKGQGVELDPEAVMKSIDLGVPVINIDLDQGLSDFEDKSFNYVILESTLQTLKSPLSVLKEMLRVGQNGVVSFPNFGYWRVRMDLIIRGRMPVTSDLPYGWYNTPNIHLFTIADFLDWCTSEKVEISKAFGLTEGKVHALSPEDNLTAEEALLFLKA